MNQMHGCAKWVSDYSRAVSECLMATVTHHCLYWTCVVFYAEPSPQADLVDRRPGGVMHMWCPQWQLAWWLYDVVRVCGPAWQETAPKQTSRRIDSASSPSLILHFFSGRHIGLPIVNVFQTFKYFGGHRHLSNWSGPAHHCLLSQTIVKLTVKEGYESELIIDDSNRTHRVVCTKTQCFPCPSCR